ncbi:MAG: (d)CMP kinase [Fimbriimonadaceae bacterium]|jgi:cytidylate kinase|nr:(d)CMP kinase [Fimbriimonadaceae bacterium]
MTNLPNRNDLIAIDGPAGSGKSTVAKLLSQLTGLKVLDTGAMYRCLALKALQEGISQDDEEKLVELGNRTDISFGGTGGEVPYLDGEPVGEEIRTLEVGQAASQISTLPGVRSILVAQQKSVISQGGYILEGRDVTTVVAPDASLKIFLTASIEERARRRWLQMKETSPETPLTDVVIDVVRRDHRDYTRNDSPLQLAVDAVIVETFGLNPREVAEKIASLLPG